MLGPSTAYERKTKLVMASAKTKAIKMMPTKLSASRQREGAFGLSKDDACLWRLKVMLMLFNYSMRLSSKRILKQSA